jgi:alpha-N-arabinofuranosidase
MRSFIYIDLESILHVPDKRIYGQFIEHLGRCIYGGIRVGENSSIPNLKVIDLMFLKLLKGLNHLLLDGLEVILLLNTTG